MTAPPGSTLTPPELDQAVIDAGRAYVAAQRAEPRDLEQIAAARQALEDARAARGYAGA